MNLQRFTAQMKLTNYIPLPRAVLEMGLNSTQILLYALLLDRATLSVKHDYTDFGDWVYVVYTEEELSRILSVSTRIIRKYTCALESAGLLRKERISRKQANRLFLLVPSNSVTGTGSGTKLPVDRNNISKHTGTKVPPNNIKEQHNLSKLYQHTEEESI